MPNHHHGRHDDHDQGDNDIATTLVLDDYSNDHGRALHVYNGVDHDDTIAADELDGDQRTAALHAIRAAINTDLRDDVPDADAEHVGDLERLRADFIDALAAEWEHPLTERTDHAARALRAAINRTD